MLLVIVRASLLFDRVEQIEQAAALTPHGAHPADGTRLAREHESPFGEHVGDLAREFVNLLRRGWLPSPAFAFGAMLLWHLLIPFR
jgi:hypothetical protein